MIPFAKKSAEILEEISVTDRADRSGDTQFLQASGTTGAASSASIPTLLDAELDLVEKELQEHAENMTEEVTFSEGL